jgi:hypothetical protein
MFFLIYHLKNGGLSYNRAQSSKKRANVFVITNTVKICLGWVVQLFHCIIFFILSRTMRPHLWQHLWIGKCFFSVVVLWNVSRLGSTLQLFPSVKMAYETPRIYHVLYHASCCMSMMCTLFLKTEYTLSLILICITNLTTCNTFFT